MTKTNQKLGIIITLFAGTLWGFSGTCGQYIFENFNSDPGKLTAARLLLSGLMLTIIGLVKTPEAMKDIWKKKTSISQLLLFAILGLMCCQLSYMEAIANSNSSTATILQYIGPVLIIIVSCFLSKRLPSKIEFLAIMMALLGTYLIATHGNIHTMVITPKGLAWGIASAFTLMLYNMLPVNLIRKYGSIAVTGYGMLIGGIVLSLITRLWEAKIIWSSSFILSFLSIVMLGTILAFTLYLLGVAICGPVKASMLSSIEPVSATIFMVVWLKVPIHPIDLLGFLCIFVTIFLLAKKDH